MAKCLASSPSGSQASLTTSSPTVTGPNSTARSRRPAVILPGLGNNSGDYSGLVSVLKSHGVPSVVADVSRIDWLRNAAGLADANYWRGTLRPRPILDWYLERIEDAVSQAKQLGGDDGLSLVGHSAGGWLARLFMEESGAAPAVSLLLTLGSPLLPPPKGVAGVVDQTRGLLDYVQRHCAPAVYSPELRYVCVAGRYIKGARLFGSTDSGPTQFEGQNLRSAAPTNTIQARLVGQSYKQVCGRADVWGDGVVPEMSAHLHGALNISLDGVYHSPVGSDDLQRQWYGSPAVVDHWIHHLLDSSLLSLQPEDSICTG